MLLHSPSTVASYDLIARTVTFDGAWDSVFDPAPRLLSHLIHEYVHDLSLRSGMGTVLACLAFSALEGGVDAHTRLADIPPVQRWRLRQFAHLFERFRPIAEGLALFGQLDHDFASLGQGLPYLSHFAWGLAMPEALAHEGCRGDYAHWRLSTARRMAIEQDKLRSSLFLPDVSSAPRDFVLPYYAGYVALKRLWRSWSRIDERLSSPTLFFELALAALMGGASTHSLISDLIVNDTQDLEALSVPVDISRGGLLHLISPQNQLNFFEKISWKTLRNTIDVMEGCQADDISLINWPALLMHWWSTQSAATPFPRWDPRSHAAKLCEKLNCDPAPVVSFLSFQGIMEFERQDVILLIGQRDRLAVLLTIGGSKQMVAAPAAANVARLLRGELEVVVAPRPWQEDAAMAVGLVRSTSETLYCGRANLIRSYVYPVGATFMLLVGKLVIGLGPGGFKVVPAAEGENYKAAVAVLHAAQSRLSSLSGLVRQDTLSFDAPKEGNRLITDIALETLGFVGIGGPTPPSEGAAFPATLMESGAGSDRMGSNPARDIALECLECSEWVPLSGLPYRRVEELWSSNHDVLGGPLLIQNPGDPDLVRANPEVVGGANIAACPKLDGFHTTEE